MLFTFFTCIAAELPIASSASVQFVKVVFNMSISLMFFSLFVVLVHVYFLISNPARVQIMVQLVAAKCTILNH